MKFHQWQSIYRDYEKRGLTAPDTVLKPSVIDDILRLLPNGQAFFEYINFDYCWIKNQRPYYRVYPLIEELLIASSLDFPGAMLPKPIEIVSFEFSDKTITCEQSCLFVRASFPGDGSEYLICYRLQDKEEIHITLKNDQTIEDMIRSGDMMSERDEKLFRIYVGACLLANDPDLMEPVVLNRDADKYARSDEATRKIIEDRAARLNGRGWAIGKGFEERCEQSPHFRKSHLALYWTGKGGKVPRLQLRKGCVVKPRDVTKMPTGYYGKEETFSVSDS